MSDQTDQKQQGPHEKAMREALDHFNENLERLLADEDVEFHPFLAPDIEFINYEPSPFPGTYRGYDGLRRWTHDLFDPFADARWDAIEVVEDGDLMAVKMRVTGRGRSSGAPFTGDWGSLVEIRDGRCIRAASDTTFERTLERFEQERGREVGVD
jgi:ketosteroid isomerase-like protein